MTPEQARSLKVGDRIVLRAGQPGREAHGVITEIDGNLYHVEWDDDLWRRVLPIDSVYRIEREGGWHSV
jgi:hypothetical protein